MIVKGQQHFPYTAATVFSAFGAPHHIEEKQRFLGSRNIDIRQCEQTDSALDLKIIREVPAEAPAMLRKFISEWNRVTQEEHWRENAGEYRAQVKVDIQGVPVSINGEMRLYSEGEGSVHEVTLNFECRVPLVGKKLAEFVAAKSQETMQNEFAFVADYLRANL
ncbi:MULTISPECIES: DUF2505 domain-containing protein [unclassified Hahella]|uniref:DUF2505 domain-containing protein n=1 Tax=unclassified Hahella TaxID=2624107 RepID=UPI001C1ED22C|nr:MULTISPECIES: DUF2505 domain-containing protein [unclassified Hahella]MBU6950938.1 DUF2505 domain-containing protein [Hahella sp. HN01]MDG9666668.1 DUF2505 domain-containing protein [Hahella sp. CR1]